MKYSMYLILALFLYSCGGEKGSFVLMVNNNSYHYVEVDFYNNSTSPEKTLIIHPRTADNSITSDVKSGTSLITQNYDSVIFTFEDTISITHYSLFNNLNDTLENNILDDNNWTTLQTTEVKRKDFRTDVIYTITEQDYINAK